MQLNNLYDRNFSHSSLKLGKVHLGNPTRDCRHFYRVVKFETFPTREQVFVKVAISRLLVAEDSGEPFGLFRVTETINFRSLAESVEMSVEPLLLFNKRTWTLNERNMTSDGKQNALGEKIEDG